MKIADASNNEWKALYQAAAEFREIEPWEWVYETDIFGVQDPANGEIGFCCIMGKMGEVLAMAVYMGTEGLQGYIDIQKGLIEPDDPDSMFTQDCIMASFEDKKFLKKEDKALIKNLGLKFRGERQWPLFRRYKPGYLPWFLNRDEVLYLTIALQQARDVCLRLEEDEKLLLPPKKDLYFVRYPTAIQGDIVWKDVWMKPEQKKQPVTPKALVDEIRIQRIKKKAAPSTAVWEVDFFYAPTPISGTDRPYFPYAIMIMDRDSGFIHDTQLADSSDCSKIFLDRFLSCLERTSVLPSEILVRKKEVFQFFEPYAAELDIRLKIVKNLSMLDQTRREMTRHFQGF